MFGNLPIRVLMSEAIKAAETISPSFRELLENELTYNHLNPAIQYHYGNKPINEIAQIDSRHNIHLYENFCHYLWCIIYSMVIQFDWFTSDPKFNKIEVEQYNRAVKLFDTAFLLLSSDYNVDSFFELPNPENYNSNEGDYIEGVNSVFKYSITYMLLHEFAHHLYGDLDIDSNSMEAYKEDERKADDFAMDTMLIDGLANEKYLYELGIIFALIGIILLENHLKGGDRHPNKDERLIAALNKMESDDTWGYAAMALILWNMKHGLSIEIPPVEGSFEDLFNSTVEKINFSTN